MAAGPRPLSVTLIACLYLLVGALGLAVHFHEFLTRQPDWGWIVLTEALAVLIGIFLLRGQNWARWLAIAWIAFHVGLSVHGPVRALILHTAFLALITWALFHAAARRYFRSSVAASTL